MNLVRTIAELRQATDCCKVEKGGLGLVPTMGAFHDGHLSLFRAARAECDLVVASLFVNPAQFGANEDLDRYPRDEARDTKLAEDAGVDVLFAPAPEELYPNGYRTWVDPEGTGAEGARRPDHFRGVATVCLKLFNIVRPDVAYFGQKDAQQAAVLRRMVRDLDLELVLRVLPTVRDRDGLALSSRNAYLSTDERQRALGLPQALAAGRDAHARGADPVAAARAALNGLDPDYVEVLDLGDATVLAAAARIGSTRLIDNVVLEGELT
jgi:pantoate--beta-alanine ligase